MFNCNDMVKLYKFLKGKKPSMDYISVQSWEDYRSSNKPHEAVWYNHIFTSMYLTTGSQQQIINFKMTDHHCEYKRTLYESVTVSPIVSYSERQHSACCYNSLLQVWTLISILWIYVNTQFYSPSLKLQMV
jgi:hypothetical protein